MNSAADRVSSRHVSSRGVLLVHGAWQTEHCWDAVAERLRDRGIDVATPRLHRGSLEADTAAAEAALATVAGSRPAVALGHSYGGSVITGLQPDNLAHLVFLAATMPDIDETSLGQLASEHSDLGASPRGDPHGVCTVDPAAAGDLFHSQLNAAERARWADGLVAQDMTGGYESPATAAWKACPSTYVVCTEDHLFPPVLQNRLGQRATRTLHLPSDHGAFASHAHELADILAGLAQDDLA